METVVIIGVAAITVACWLVAFGSWVMAVRHRAEGVSLASMLLEGMRMFDSESFTAEGQRYQQWFFRAFIAFMCCIMLVMVAAIFVGSGDR